MDDLGSLNPTSHAPPPPMWRSDSTLSSASSSSHFGFPSAIAQYGSRHRAVSWPSSPETEAPSPGGIGPIRSRSASHNSLRLSLGPLPDPATFLSQPRPPFSLSPVTQMPVLHYSYGPDAAPIAQQLPYPITARSASFDEQATPEQRQKYAERPYKCNQCVQAFQRAHDLKRHKRIHLEVKPFRCGWCPKQFSRRDALKRHLLVKLCGADQGQTKELSEQGISVCPALLAERGQVDATEASTPQSPPPTTNSAPPELEIAGLPAFFQVFDYGVAFEARPADSDLTPLPPARDILPVGLAQAVIGGTDSPVATFSDLAIDQDQFQSSADMYASYLRDSPRLLDSQSPSPPFGDV